MRQLINYLFLTALGLVFLTGCQAQKASIRGPQGEITYKVTLPDGFDTTKDHCPMVLLMHGIFSSKDYGPMPQLAKGLAEAGIASIRFDFNGHGESEGDFSQMTVPGEIEDALRVYEWVTKDGRFGRVGIAGHSQGGVVTAMLAGRLGRKAFRGGVVLLAPAGVIRDDAIRGSVPGQSSPAGDPLDPPEYIEVWGHHLGRDYIKTAFWLPIYETAAHYKGPACIVHGTSDRTVPYTYGLRFHQLWKRSEWHLLDRYDHGFGPHPEEAVRLAVAFFTGRMK